MVRECREGWALGKRMGGVWPWDASLIRIAISGQEFGTSRVSPTGGRGKTLRPPPPCQPGPPPRVGALGQR